MDEKYLEILDQYEKLAEERDRHEREIWEYPIANDPLTLLEDSIERVYSPARDPWVPDFYPDDPLATTSPPRTDPRALGPPPSDKPPPGLDDRYRVPAVPYEPWFHIRPPAKGHQLGSHSGSFSSGPRGYTRLRRMPDGFVWCREIRNAVNIQYCWHFCEHWNPDKGCTYGKNEEGESEVKESWEKEEEGIER